VKCLDFFSFRMLIGVCNSAFFCLAQPRPLLTHLGWLPSPALTTAAGQNLDTCQVLQSIQGHCVLFPIHFAMFFIFLFEFRGRGGAHNVHMELLVRGKESENVELNCSRQFNINILNRYTIFDNRNLFSIIKQKPDCLEICFNSQQCIRRGGVSNFVSFAMCCTLVS